MKTVVAFRHVHFEDLGTLEPLLGERGFVVRYLDPAVDDIGSIDAASADVAVVLGGPIGAYDEGSYPFLVAELRWIERRLASGRPLLGICLGAQLIARALGARVAPMGYKEIGFGELALVGDSVLQPLAGVPVLHWHGDHFELPSKAVALASSERCVEQAFAVGDTVLGLQFHLEVDPDRIESWLVGHANELAHAGVDPSGIRADARRHGPALVSAARRTLGGWLDRLSAPNASRT